MKLSPRASRDAVQQQASLRDDVMELRAFESSALVVYTHRPLDPQGRSGHSTDWMRGSVGSSTIFTLCRLLLVPAGDRNANLRSARQEPSLYSTPGTLLLYGHVCIRYLFCLLYRVAGNCEFPHQILLEVWNSGLSTALPSSVCPFLRTLDRLSDGVHVNVMYRI